MPRLRLERSAGYGCHLWIGRHLRLGSGRSLTPMWPHVYKSGDEFCNDVLDFHLWPLGGVDIWWRRTLRTGGDGRCASCRAEAREMGCCEGCMSRPCSCAGDRVA